MAKRKGANKSATIRELLASGVTDNATILEKLKAKKINASPGLISNIKTKGKKRGRKSGRGAVQNGNFLSEPALIAGSVFIKKCGSIEAAQATIATLGKLI